jgi:ferredoxin
MRILVDYEQCETNGLCVAAAPEVFEIDDDDHMVLLVEHPSSELLAKVEEAVRLCPKQALSVQSD